ncbi:MAG: capsular polysaccharide synthesis protein [Balneolales bacterium]
MVTNNSIRKIFSCGFSELNTHVRPCAIVQYWDEGCPPLLIRQRMDEWRLTNPGLNYKFFDRDLAASTLYNIYGSTLRNAFLKVKLPAMQADIFRVAFLCAYGGIWIDAATVCLAPLQKWLDFQSSLLLLRKPQMEPPLACNGFIYSSAPNHPFLVSALKLINYAILERPDGGVWKLFGAGMFREIMLNKNFEALVTVIPSTSVASCLQFGSSREALPSHLHWSVRQKNESLYIK